MNIQNNGVEMDQGAFIDQRKKSLRTLRIHTSNPQRKPRFDLILYLEMTKQDWEFFTGLIMSDFFRRNIGHPDKSENENFTDKNFLSIALISVMYHFPEMITEEMKEDIACCAEKVSPEMQVFCSLIIRYLDDRLALEEYQLVFHTTLYRHFGKSTVDMYKVETINDQFRPLLYKD